MPAEWHKVHDKLLEENPDMPDSQAWAIATNVYKKHHGGHTPQQDASPTEHLRNKALEKKPTE